LSSPALTFFLLLLKQIKWIPLPPDLTLKHMISPPIIFIFIFDTNETEIYQSFYFLFFILKQMKRDFIARRTIQGRQPQGPGGFIFIFDTNETEIRQSFNHNIQK